jgi:hypothetical protein
MTDGTETLEVAYLALGRLIAGQCPPGFQTARLELEIEGAESRLILSSIQPNGAEVAMPPSEEAARDILESLRGIRKAMAKEDDRPWRGCVVTLIAGGGFQLDIGY